MPNFADIVEKFRGRSISSFADRWRRARWDRQMAKATARAHELVDEYRRGEEREARLRELRARRLADKASADRGRGEP